MARSILFILIFSSVFFSCGSWDCHPREEKCPLVEAADVPLAVSEGFILRYPRTQVSAWFNKKGNGYCAFFDDNGKIAKANFDNNGGFLYEEFPGDRNSNRMHGKSGCVCEL